MGLVRGAYDPARLAVVRGRCVAAESGKPIAGCVVRLEGKRRANVAVPASVDWLDPRPVQTDERGTFLVWLMPCATFECRLEVRSDGRVPRTGYWSGLVAGQKVDLGDVALQIGHPLTGVVVDEQGLPLARIGVRVGGLPLPVRPGFGVVDFLEGTSDERGRFTIGAPLPAGTWPLSVAAEGWTVAAPLTVSVEEARGAADLRVALRPVPSISGHVFDARGRPAGGVLLRVSGESPAHAPSGRSRADGSFSIYRVDGLPDEVQLEIGDAADWEPRELPEFYRWGQGGLRFELPGTLSLDLTVVEQGTGLPVEDYAVRCHPTRVETGPLLHSRLDGRHPGGDLRVDRIWRGENRLWVVPADVSLAPSADTVFVAGRDPLAPLRVELERLVPIDVRVLALGGEPQAGVQVQAVDRRGLGDELTVVADPRAGNVSLGSPPLALPVVLSSATSDARGDARLYVRRDGETIVRSLGGPAWTLARVTLPRAPKAGEPVVLQGTAAK